MRSASVDLPWSMWAMMQKLRMWLSVAHGGSGAVGQGRGRPDTFAHRVGSRRAMSSAP